MNIVEQWDDILEDYEFDHTAALDYLEEESGVDADEIIEILRIADKTVVTDSDIERIADMFVIYNVNALHRLIWGFTRIDIEQIRRVLS